MSFTGIQATIDFYTVQKNDLTNDVTDIMMQITQATNQISSLSVSTCQAREEARAYYGDVTSSYYQYAIAQIEDDYESKLAVIQSWETELQTQKDTKQTELQATTSYIESFKSAEKENIQKDFKYGGGSSS